MICIKNVFQRERGGEGAWGPMAKVLDSEFGLQSLFNVHFQTNAFGKA